MFATISATSITRYSFRFFDVEALWLGQEPLFQLCKGARFYGWPPCRSYFGASARLGALSPPLWAALFLAGPLGCFVLFLFFS